MRAIRSVPTHLGRLDISATEGMDGTHDMDVLGEYSGDQIMPAMGGASAIEFDDEDLTRFLNSADWEEWQQ